MVKDCWVKVSLRPRSGQARGKRCGNAKYQLSQIGTGNLSTKVYRLGRVALNLSDYGFPRCSRNQSIATSADLAAHGSL
jgi:hypothetical protein